MRATFQIVLKTPVYPPYFLARKLFDLIQAEAVAIGDYDFADVGEWISVNYYTAYNNVPRRHLLGITLEIPPEIDEAIARRIIEGDADNKTLDSFGSLLQADEKTVEAVLRYEDDGLIADINKYHPEIFTLEMKLREVLNYILCYNLARYDVFDFIRAFDISLKGRTLKTEITEFKRKSRTDKKMKHPFSLYFENELFHLVVSDYKDFKNPFPRNFKSLKSKVGACKNIDEVRTWLKEKVDFSKLNPEHQSFIANIATRINPIEDLRNAIMHNRRIPLAVINDFENAKNKTLGWIEDFWRQEQEAEENRIVEPIKQAEFLLRILDKSIVKSGNSFQFFDLNIGERYADDREDLKIQFMEIINEKIVIENQDGLEYLIDDRLNLNEELLESYNNPINPFPIFLR